MTSQNTNIVPLLLAGHKVSTDTHADLCVCCVCVNETRKQIIPIQIYLYLDDMAFITCSLVWVIHCTNPETSSALETSAHNKTTYDGTPTSGSSNEVTITNSHLDSLPQKPF